MVPRSSQFSPGTAANIGAAITPVGEAKSLSARSLLPGGRVDEGVGPLPKLLTSISDVNLIETQLQLDVDSEVCIFSILCTLSASISHGRFKHWRNHVLN